MAAAFFLGDGWMDGSGGLRGTRGARVPHSVRLAGTGTVKQDRAGCLGPVYRCAARQRVPGGMRGLGPPPRRGKKKSPCALRCADRTSDERLHSFFFSVGNFPDTGPTPHGAAGRSAAHARGAHFRSTNHTGRWCHTGTPTRQPPRRPGPRRSCGGQSRSLPARGRAHAAGQRCRPCSSRARATGWHPRPRRWPPPPAASGPRRARMAMMMATAMPPPLTPRRPLLVSCLRAARRADVAASPPRALCIHSQTHTTLPQARSTGRPGAPRGGRWPRPGGERQQVVALGATPHRQRPTRPRRTAAPSSTRTRRTRAC